MKAIDFIKQKKMLFSALGLFLIISTISISYASMNISMMITGNAYVRVDEEIRVVGIKFLSAENDAYETYNGKYSKNSTNMYTTLPNVNSKITYQVEIENKSDHVYLISDITGDLVNPNIQYSVENGVIKVVPKKSKILVNITFQYHGETLPSDITQIATINYKFERPTASHLQFNNSKSGTECIDVQCALDELYRKFSSTSAVKSKFAGAYSYNQISGSDNYCVTGEEDSCVKTDCYTSSTKTCPEGTIIDYIVNENIGSMRFHVLHDEGTTIVMQTQKNTVYNTDWYSTAVNTKGPLTVLSALESVTENWTHVNTQTYTMGTTNFNGTNSYTGCSAYNKCNSNTYTLGQRTVRARMITVQEASKLGCTNTYQTCPQWMYNYLSQSTSYGGLVNDNSKPNYGYWTMCAYSSGKYVWHMAQQGRLHYSIDPTYSGIGARAVVTVAK